MTRPLRSTLRLALGFAPTLVLLPVALAAYALRALAPRRWLRFAVGVQTLWARATLRVLGIELDLPAEPPPAARFVVANHLSYLDVLVLAAVLPGRFVAKHEIAGWPLVGLLSRVGGTLFVDRGRGRDIPRVAAEIERTLADGLAVLMFPEGGTSGGERVGRFHPALLEPARGIGCLPVALGYRTPGEPWAPSWTVCWWGGAPLWPHLWRLLGLGRVVARVRWARAPVRADDRKRLAEQAREAVAELFEPVPQAPRPPGRGRPEPSEGTAGG